MPDTVVAGYLDAGVWSASFGLSLRDACLYDAGHNRRMIRPGARELRQVCGAGGIAAARDRLAADFLATGADWLWMVDTDMGFEADTVDRLIASADPAGRPVVGALCFAVQRIAPAACYAERIRIIPTVYEYADGAEPGFKAVLDYPRDRLVRVDGTGAACLLIHRTALETMLRACGTWFGPMTADGGPAFSEDLSFCLRLRALGVPLHVDTAVKTSHHKGVLYLDEETFAGQGVACGAG